MKTRLLLAPSAADGGGNPPPTLPAKESSPPEGALGTEGISDAIDLLEIPAAVAEQFKAAEKPAAKPAEAKATEAIKPADEPEEKPEGETEKPEGGEETKPEEEAAQAPEFNAEQQAWLKENFETPLATAKAEAETATARVTELEAKVADLETAPPPVTAQLHPLALVEDSTKIDAYEEGLEKFIAWGRENWDGSAEVPAAGEQPAQRAYSASEIRKAVTEREHELRKLIPAARQTLSQRQQLAAVAKTRYPELFDSKKPEGQVLQTMLRQWPFLKAIPNFHMIAGDAFRGEKIRLAEEKAKATLKPTPKINTPPKTVPKATPGAKSPVATMPKDKGPDVQKFIARKGTATDEVTALAEVLG